MRLVATEQFVYDHQTRQPGEEFDAEELHGKLLIQRGTAREALGNAPSKLMTTQINAEIVPPNQPGKRTYKRRDLRAED